ncbi:MAG: hypothetical protein EBU90_31235, partial [Proteobacteria bacterium]|nr:hypothetical protein [Pseudomonadota bacterium]
MIEPPRELVVEKFFQYNYRPKFNRYNDTYQGGCAICKEGKSLAKKRRCYYIPEHNNIFCHNCGWNSNTYNWIKRVTGVSDTELIQEIQSYSSNEPLNIVTEEKPVKLQLEDLPGDAIDLFDEQQVLFYSDNKIVQKCVEFIKNRRLDIAVNRPKSLYVSLKDFTHKNRLIIPFYNERNQIEFYQTRTILITENTKPKYLSKFNSDKTLYGLNNISLDHNCVYVFEGPINAMFMKNSVAVAGIQKGNQLFTARQQEQFDTNLKWYKRIWVLDSQWLDETSRIKTEKLIDQGEHVFIWPEKYGKCFKDFNEITMKYNLSEISSLFVNNNVFDPLTSLL